jgi:methionine-S-sulfoxide reductase
MDREIAVRMETASFALGCFWGPEARFGVINGVVHTRVGYAGGTTPHPRYRDLGDHSETVQVDFDPAVITYAELLDVFWKSHNPSRVFSSPRIITRSTPSDVIRNS